jgi:hypothetical protein
MPNTVTSLAPESESEPLTYSSNVPKSPISSDEFGGVRAVVKSAAKAAWFNIPTTAIKAINDRPMPVNAPFEESFLTLAQPTYNIGQFHPKHLVEQL